MSTPPAGLRSNLVLASLSVIVAVADGGLAAIGWLTFNAHRHGHLSASEAAPFTLLGASATVGLIVTVLAAVALTRGARGRGTARVASGLAWTRTAGVIAALIVIPLWLGGAAIIGMLETFGVLLTAIDTIGALIVAGIAVRRTHHG